MATTMMDWTETAIQTLTAMLGAGSPYSEIAVALGTTRNACIGKARRLGISSGNIAPPRPSSPRRVRRLSVHSSLAAPANAPKPVEAASVVPAPAPPPPPPGGKGVLFARLRPDHCRFIPGHPAGARTVYCGEPVSALGQSYCGYHRSVCFRAAGDEKAAA